MTDAVPVMLNQVSTPAGVTEGWTAGGVRKCEVAAAVRFRGAEHAWVGRWGLYGAICQAGHRSPAGRAARLPTRRAPAFAADSQFVENVMWEDSRVVFMGGRMPALVHGMLPE